MQVLDVNIAVCEVNLSLNSLIVLSHLLIWFFSGEKDIPGLTDSTVPRRLGPKRASKIRKLFNLAKEDDVRQYVVRRPLTKEGKLRTFSIAGFYLSHQDFFYFIIG